MLAGDGRMTPASAELSRQVAWLFLLAIPIACVTWTVTHEEIFREPRDYCVRQTERRRHWMPRKFFYVFTCEYCFSHYVTLAFVVLTRYRLLLDDWRGFVVGYFALVGVTNVYISLFGRLRVDIKTERLEAVAKEREIGRDDAAS
jgi:hypothetical protein